MRTKEQILAKFDHIIEEIKHENIPIIIAQIEAQQLLAECLLDLRTNLAGILYKGYGKESEDIVFNAKTGIREIE